MGKQHEILAVEPDAAGAFKRLFEEAGRTFGSKESLFKGFVKKTTMFDDDSKPIDDEISLVSETVDGKLQYIQPAAINYFNITLQKDLTNQQATGTVVVDGLTIIENAPVTWLLNMESHLKKVRETYEQIPNLSPGISWLPDENLGRGIYRAEHEIQTFKTKKTTTAVVLYEATDKHPAQVREVPEDVRTGEYRKLDHSGMISSQDKADRLARLDKLIQAFKKARMQANDTDVVQRDIGDVLFNYIDQGPQ